MKERNLLVMMLSVIIFLLLLVLGKLYGLVGWKGPKVVRDTERDGTCSKETCGALDPVNDPDYNLRNVVKQSILLEEHLAEKQKYCLGCCVKHFQHIIGLCEEAVWLAGAHVAKYPMLEDSVGFYQKCFDTWLAGREDPATKLAVLALLRERRRKLVDVYYLA